MRPYTAKSSKKHIHSSERPLTGHPEQMPLTIPSNINSKKTLRIPVIQNYNISQKHWNIASDKITNAALYYIQ